MPDNRNIWCVTNKNGWAVKHEGQSTPVHIFRSRDEAWSTARKMAREYQGKAFLQDIDGRVHDSA